MTEKCQKCGEEGEDRRTLFMSCFYAMEELGIPLDEIQIRGTFHAKIGVEVLPTIQATVPVFAKEGGTMDQRNFYTLRVCKECRGSWMAAIKKWFETPAQQEESCGSGIFVRENGVNIEITEEEWRRRAPGREPVRLKP